MTSIHLGYGLLTVGSGLIGYFMYKSFVHRAKVKRCFHCDDTLGENASESADKCVSCDTLFCNSCNDWICTTDSKCESCDHIGEAIFRGSKKRLQQMY